MGAIALVDHFFIIFFFFGGSPFNGCFHAVFGHVYPFGILNSGAQTGVAIGIRPTFLHGDHNFLTQPRKGFRHLIPTFKLAGFPEFKCSSHIIGA
jgi:hypothetical protein